MPVRPAYETILHHDEHVVTLRASLRAAVALDNLPGGIPSAWESLMRQSYTGIRQVLLATATDRAAAFFLLSSLSEQPLAPFIAKAQAALLELMVNLFPPAEEAPASPRSKPTPIRDYLGELYKFGTSVLEWPPSEVWQASPAEIEAVLRARLEQHEAMEAAMPPEQRQASLDAGQDPIFDRQGLRALKARHGA